MRTRVVLAAAIALGACKDKQPAQSPPAPAPASAPSVGSGTASEKPVLPASPTPAAKPLGDPLTIEEAAGVLPKIDGKEILPLKQTSDKRQVHGTWCIDGDGAEDVAKKVGRTMAGAGFTSLVIRGDAKKAGVQGDRSGFRMSMVVSASSAPNCPAPLHYFASATIYRP